MRRESKTEGQRPKTHPVMHQNWGKLLFMHWRIDEKLLRPLIPQPLEIDLFEGSAWIAVVPFTMWDIRAFPPYVPPVPGLSAMHELNVRTYVRFNGVAGVWFFSLDCNSRVAVQAARRFFYLPYYNADMELKENDGSIDYQSNRTGDPPANFQASWRIGNSLPYSEPGSLTFFLTERYYLYTYHEDKIYRARIHHQRWPLQSAEVQSFTSTMIESQGLPSLTAEPLLHYAEEVSVDIWPLEKL